MQALYLGGQFVQTKEVIDVINPFTKSKIDTCCMADEKNVEEAIVRAKNAKLPLLQLQSYQKAEILNQIAHEIALHKEELVKLIVMESAKPIMFARLEVERAVDTFTIAAEECKRISGEFFSLDQTKSGSGKNGLIKYFPVGIIGGISPFNFPLNLVAHKIAPAIAASCPVLLKPSSATPLTALFLAQLIHKTNLPKGSVSVLPCNRETGNLLVTHSEINLLTFTGSPEVGWQMKKNAGKKKVVLELGGNAAAYIHKDADVNAVLKQCLTGGFTYSGQVCIHTQRIYVHQNLFEEFKNKYIAAVQELRFGDPFDLTTGISVMINDANAKRIEQWVAEALEDGAELLCGGKRTENYYEPTVLTRTKNGMRIFDEEAFGPIVCLEQVADEEEAITRMNQSRFGLQASIFTNDFRLIQKAWNAIEAGAVLVNEITTFRVDNMPYGGIKDSGLGREGVAYAIQEYMEPKLLVY